MSLRDAPKLGGLEHLEGLFNPVGQQRGGLLWCLLKLRPGRDRDHPVIASLSRGPFNSNPVLAGYLGGCLALRLSRAANETDPNEAEDAVERIRGLFAPLLAGIGDRILYGGIRPLLSLAGIFSAVIWFGDPGLWYWVGYNGLQIYWRRRSWRVGIQGEDAVRQEIRGRSLERWAGGSAKAARFFLGATLGAAATGIWLSQGVTWAALFALICLLGFLLTRSGRLSPLLWGWIALLAAGLVALARLGLERGKV